MNSLHSLILGMVEGATEFLPVSSTFHLLITGRLLHINENDFYKFFAVFIQSGAILAVLILYFKELINNINLSKKIIVAFIPTAIIGFLLYKVIKNTFFGSFYLMIGMFLIIGIIFIVTEFLVKNKTINLKKDLEKLSYKEAILIGLIQSLAVIPGVSRAGSVILGMMFFGYKRESGAKFSFMLAIPTVFAASFYDLFKMREVILSGNSNLNLLLIGFVSAFIFAYIAVKWLIGYLQKNTLTVFGIYRIALAIILLLVLR